MVVNQLLNMSENIEKEKEWLLSTVIPEILKNGKLVENYSEEKENTFKVDTIDLNVIGGNEAFMLTNCFRATINFEYAGEHLTRKFVIKKTPVVPPDVYEAIQFGDLFINEIDFYTEILPKIKNIAQGKFAAPKYYYSDFQPLSACIILGDFATDGWRVPKETVGLSLEHARIAVQYLGRFHGFCYALKHKDPVKFKEITDRLKESRYAKDDLHPEWATILKTGLKRTEKAVAKYQPEIDTNFTNKFINLVSDYVQYGRERVKPREPLAVLCHGDYLRNNVAYKYDENEQPLEIMMFDYQTLRYSSPMIDLSVFLSVSVYSEVRHKHFDMIFDDYCKQLFESYQKYSEGQLPEYLNRENLLKEYIRFMPYSTNITSSFLLNLVDPPEITPAERMNNPLPVEELIEDVMTRGGEIVDRELSYQVKEMFDLSRQYNIDIAEDIKPKA